MCKVVLKVLSLLMLVLGMCGLSLVAGPMWLNAPREVILGIRLPRLLLGIFAGLSLSVSGAALQGILQNPLADPYILGISGGACTGAVLAIIFKAPVPPLAFLGAIISISVVYRLAAFRGRIPKDTLLLSGVVVGMFCSAVVMLVMALVGRELHEIIYLLMGNLGLIFVKQSYRGFWVVFGISVCILCLIISRGKELNILSLGEEEALTLGVEVERLKKEIFVLSSLLVGFCVAFCGAIGFIGLMVPHLTRKIVGPDHRVLLLFAPMVGVLLILFADIVARNILVFELPVGVITALLGVPFFVWLLRRRKT